MTPEQALLHRLARQQSEQLAVLAAFAYVVQSDHQSLPDAWATELSKQTGLAEYDVLRVIPRGVIEGKPGNWFLTDVGLVLARYATALVILTPFEPDDIPY